MYAKIYYATRDTMVNSLLGWTYIKRHRCSIYIQLLHHDLSGYRQIAVSPVTDLSEIFRYYQGENWSPEGEARDLIQGLGLNHTSMSVGDVVVVGDVLYFCDCEGWVEIKKE